MFIAISKFTIANDMADAVQQAFAGRPKLVDAADGFLGMEVMHPVGNPSEVWLLTRWHDEASYLGWHRSQAHHASMRGIPKGLKLIPGSAEVMMFHVFSN